MMREKVEEISKNVKLRMKLLIAHYNNSAAAMLIDYQDAINNRQQSSLNYMVENYPSGVNSILRHLSSKEIMEVKGVSRAFYKQTINYLTGNFENEKFHLKEVIPPSDSIKRQQQITFYAESLHELMNHLSSAEKRTPEELDKFINMVEKMRQAVQSNLGLSENKRDKHETFHPIYIKMGAPIFPGSQASKFDNHSIIYQTSPEEGDKKSPRVILLKDDSNEEGLSICFDTLFRKFILHIDGKGMATSHLTLNWVPIYNDLLPNKTLPQPLRAFTPWQRHSEANFFNGRSTDKILELLTKTYPGIFEYTSTSYFKEEDNYPITLDANTKEVPYTDKKNIYLTMDESYFEKSVDFKCGLRRQSLLVMIKTYSSLRGECFSVVPAIYENNALHIIIKGHQEQTEVVKVFFASIETGVFQSWQLLKPITISAASLKAHQPRLIALNLLSKQESELMSHISTAPMVRGSGPGARQYWLNEFLTGTIYSEMIVIAEIFNTHLMDKPIDSLERALNHADAAKSFYRLQFSLQELVKAKAFVFQLAIPNEFSNKDDFQYFYGNNGNKLEETTKLAIQLLMAMVPEEFHSKIRLAINMCCPAKSVVEVGAGFGLRNHPEYIDRIIKTVKEDNPNLKVEFKILMLSNEDDKANKEEIISEAKNENLTTMLYEKNANRLVYQGKTRNVEIYDAKLVSGIMKNAKTSSEFQFGYSGMVAALKNDCLKALGYEIDGKPHYSVESILEIAKGHSGEVAAGYEVMLGRVLLGSAWLLRGRYASDAEIILHALLQGAIEQEWAEGMGQYGVDIFQIQILYHVRHMTNDEHRNSLINKVLNVGSMQEIIDEMFVQYVIRKKGGQCNMLELHDLEQAVLAALPNNIAIHRDKLITAPNSTFHASSHGWFGPAKAMSNRDSSESDLNQNNGRRNGKH